MSRFAQVVVGIALASVPITAMPTAPSPVAMKIPAPELRGIDAWVNSEPLSLKSLKGKVVAFHFWTFG